MTYFFDLDGTLTIHGTNDLLPGALELLTGIIKNGDQIVFTTRRGDDWAEDNIYGKKRTLEFLESLKKEYGINYEAVIFNLNSPRIVVNDDGVGTIEHKTNEPWI